MFVKPAPGVIVRDPATKRPLPPDGKDVPESNYWLRRLRDGDVSADASPVLDSPVPDMVEHDQIQDSEVTP